MKVETKSKFKSLTIQAGSVIILLQSLPALVAELDKMVPMNLSTNPKMIAGLTIASGIVAIYGRLRANTKLT